MRDSEAAPTAIASAGTVARSRDITVTVCNFNGADYLPDCLAAIRAQSCPPARIRVYDNASTDDSVVQVRQRFPDVEVVAMGRNDGPCPPRNRGLEEAGTRWVLQVDSDVILEPDCLAKLHAAASDSAAAIVMPRAVFDGDVRRVHYDGGSFHYVGVMTLRNFFAPKPSHAEAPVEVDAVISMALLVDREKVLAAGGYHEDFFILFEDHDLSYRLRAAGETLLLVPAAEVRHREGTAGISYREGPRYPRRRAFLHSRNRWMVLLRNHSAGALVLGLPGILIYEATWLVFALARGNLGAYVHGKWEVLRALPDLLRQRRQLARRRRVRDAVLLRADDLTHAPMVKTSSLGARLDRLLSRVLRAWWRLVLPLLR